MFSMLVVATSGTGFILGSGSSIDYLGLCCTCAGTMMVAASANSLNQVFALLLFNFLLVVCASNGGLSSITATEK